MMMMIMMMMMMLNDDDDTTNELCGSISILLLMVDGSVSSATIFQLQLINKSA